jgi:hypothetical protein
MLRVGPLPLDHEEPVDEIVRAAPSFVAPPAARIPLPDEPAPLADHVPVVAESALADVAPVASNADDLANGRGCTAAQLRRFIKSRPYVPMHELRRRFGLNGGSDDVTPIATGDGTVFVGLPERESGFIAELVSQGDVGLELCRDPFVPMVVGVYAMRPISRQ